MHQSITELLGFKKQGFDKSFLKKTASRIGSGPDLRANSLGISVWISVSKMVKQGAFLSWKEFLNHRAGEDKTRWEEYLAQERKWLRNTNLQVGDKVMPVSLTSGSIAPFVGGYHGDLGVSFPVLAIGAYDDKYHPYGIQTDTDTWHPFYVLIKVDE